MHALCTPCTAHTMSAGQGTLRPQPYQHTSAPVPDPARRPRPADAHVHDEHYSPRFASEEAPSSGPDAQPKTCRSKRHQRAIRNVLMYKHRSSVQTAHSTCGAQAGGALKREGQELRAAIRNPFCDTHTPLIYSHTHTAHAHSSTAAHVSAKRG